MTPGKLIHSEEGKRAKSVKTRKPVKNISPDGLVSEIHKQTEALHRIIEKFSKQTKENDLENTPKNKGKMKNK